MRYLSLILIPFLVFGATAADWLQFRGPHGNGVSDETGLATTLGPENVAWKRDLPGRGLSSPLVVGDRVFITCSSGPDQARLHVLCFDAEDGRKLWERQLWATGQTACHEKTTVAAPSPTSDGNHIYAIFSSNDIACFDRDGNLVWFRGLMRDYPDASNGLGMSSSLLVVDGVVVAMLENEVDSFTLGLDARTGMNRWKMDRPKRANWTSPILLPSAGSSPLVALQSFKGVTAVHPRTGKVIWESPCEASGIPSLTLGEGVLYVPAAGITALQLNAENQAPEQLWQTAQLAPATASPVVAGDNLLVLNGAAVLTCAGVDDGKRRWQLRLEGPFSGSPVVAGRILYCVNEKGVLQAVDTAEPEGKIISTVELKETVLATPAIANGALYVRGDRSLWKLSGS